MTITWLSASEITSGLRAAVCGDCGAWVPSKNYTQHENFHATFTYRKDRNMSNVMWCDPGDHSFKANAPGSVHFQGTQVDENGIRQTVDTDACAEHNPYAPESTKDDVQRRRLTAQAEAELKHVKHSTTDDFDRPNYTD